VQGRDARNNQRVVLRRLGVVGATLLGLAAFAGPAQAAGVGAHDPVNFADATDPFGHFPSFYTDAEGQQVLLCVDPADAACGAVVPPDGTLPVAFDAVTPANNNFPDEAFYQTETATVGTAIQLILAQEATFDNAAGDGSQAVFGRVRIRDLDSELTPGQWYRFTYPGGQLDLLAESAARPINFSDDIGCGPAVGVACDSDTAFTAPGASNIGPVWLQKDRTGGAAAPAAGLLADVGVQKVVGSTFVPAGETQPANYFRVERISGQGGTVTGLVGQADQFDMVVPGRLAAGTPAGVLLASDGKLANQRAGQASAANTITLRNAGSGRVDLQDMAIAGADASQFALDTAGCDNGTTSLDPGESCTVGVTFTPNGTGPRSAQLVATQTNAATPNVQRSFKLLGTGVLPVVSLPSAVAFGSQLVGTTVGPRDVIIANTGDDTLHVTSAALGGANAGRYTLGLNTCNSASVAPGGQCVVQVFFHPSAGGAQDALLNLATDVGGRTVALTGTGVATAADVITLPAGGGTGAGAGTAGGAVAGIAGGAGGAIAGVEGTTLPKLTLKSLGGALRIKRSKAFRNGLRLTVRVEDGTETLKINIYRRVGATRKLLSSGFKPAGTGSLLHVSQSHLALRRALRVVGRYEVEVTPGRSRDDLGTTKKFSFRVVK
jgi:hypothetical protein